jgi:hypothetical protein
LKLCCVFFVRRKKTGRLESDARVPDPGYEEDFNSDHEVSARLENSARSGKKFQTRMNNLQYSMGCYKKRIVFFSDFLHC